MFIGILVGIIFGLFVARFVRLPLLDSSRFVESAATGFGIGLAFIVTGGLLNVVVKFLDKQSQKIKSAD